MQVAIGNIPKLRYSLTRLRVSSHRLNIECGRWTRPNIIPVNERKCQNCNVLEDEYHFVLECSLYNELRKQYLFIVKILACKNVYNY